MHRAQAFFLAFVLTGALAGCDGGSSGSNSPGSGGSSGGSSGNGGSAAGGNGGSVSSAGSAGSPQGGSAGAGGSSGNAGAAGTAQVKDACPPGKYFICEDFDDTAPGEIPAGWTKHGDPVAVSDDAAVSGAHSLKMGPIESWERRIYHDGAMLGSGHWGRIRYKVQLPVPDAFVHSTIVALRGVGPTVGIAEFRVVDTVKEDKDGFNNDGNGSHFQYLYNVQPNGAEFATGSDYSRKFDDQWHCAEWRIDGPTQSYDFYIDGAKLDQISLANGAGNYEGTEIPDSFSEVRIGWINYQKSPPGFTAWVDDVALDDERIGCDN
jgi:hypothetical protein